eukprot:COSAG02_NODE_5169_length_4575_cov_2.130920_8_plen_174_part_00
MPASENQLRKQFRCPMWPHARQVLPSPLTGRLHTPHVGARGAGRPIIPAPANSSSTARLCSLLFPPPSGASSVSTSECQRLARTAADSNVKPRHRSTIAYSSVKLSHGWRSSCGSMRNRMACDCFRGPLSRRDSASTSASASCKTQDNAVTVCRSPVCINRLRMSDTKPCPSG